MTILLKAARLDPVGIDLDVTSSPLWSGQLTGMPENGLPMVGTIPFGSILGKPDS